MVALIMAISTFFTVILVPVCAAILGFLIF